MPHVAASWGLVVKVGGSMILAATSDAVVGAAATIAVGFLAASSAIAVAYFQSRASRSRDEAAEEVVTLARQLSELEHQRAQHLQHELEKLRGEEDDGVAAE